MKRESLYESLSTIIDLYSDGYRFNEFNHPELNKLFDCKDTTITVLDKNDYIAVIFYGNFKGYNTIKKEYFNILVYRNGQIYHNVPLLYRNMLNKIINYIEIESKTYKQKEKEQELKQLKKLK